MSKTTPDGLIIINSQAELDAALSADQNARIEIGGSLDLSIRIPGSGVPFFRLKASARLEIVAGTANVEAWESSRVVAWGSSHVVAWESSRVEAWESSRVEAWESSHVVAWGSSRVVAWGSSRVEAWESSHVEAWESSRVVAWGSSHVEARESSRVEARESSRVEAWAYVAAYLFGGMVKAKAAATVSIFLNEGAACEGGHQVVVKEPVTGADWMERYGIEHDALFKVDGLDAKILAMIEGEKITLDMERWHENEGCDETNWCGTSHCRAGAAICLAGPSGFELERKYGPEVAGRMIYAVSRPDLPLPDFFASNEAALADIVKSAKEAV